MISVAFCQTHHKLLCTKHPLYCRIITLQPKADKKWAMRLSNYLVRYAKKYQLDPWRSLAIAMQESSLLSTKRYSTVMVPILNCSSRRDCNTVYKIINAISDIGIFQLHANTVKQYNFTPSRLEHDLEYMVKTHFIVLKDKIKQCKKYGVEAWSCYHSKTPVLRKRYIRHVNRYYIRRDHK